MMNKEELSKLKIKDIQSIAKINGIKSENGNRFSTGIVIGDNTLRNSVRFFCEKSGQNTNIVFDEFSDGKKTQSRHNISERTIFFTCNYSISLPKLQVFSGEPAWEFQSPHVRRLRYMIITPSGS